MPLTALRGWACFRAVHSSGRFRRGPSLTVHWLANGMDYNRYGVAAKTKTGTAVVRNRVRRWAKELLRRWDVHLDQGYDIIILANRPEAAQSYQGFAEQLAHVLTMCKLTAERLSPG
jgi:ribonuclease P protein component